MTVDEYYNKLKSPQKEICLKLREIVKKKYPKYKESMLWGVPVFNEGLIYIVALRDHVNLGFTISKLTKEEEKLFQGGGKTTRKLEIRDLNEIDTQKVEKLLEFICNR
jgi:uncharacterized protein YdhG (YjbR/CyaY superfamily)